MMQIPTSGGTLPDMIWSLLLHFCGLFFPSPFSNLSNFKEN